MARSRNESRKRRRRAAIYTPIALLLILIVVIFGVSVFFRVTQITVTGENKYKSDEILSASGIRQGDNLFMIDSQAVAAKITLNLPYLCDAEIVKTIPDKVEIKVTESQPLAAVGSNSEWWIIDQKGRALEKTDSGTAAQKIQITGLTPTSLAAGKVISVGDGDEGKRQNLINLLGALTAAGMADKCASIDLSNLAEVSFRYDSRFNVVITGGTDAGVELQRLTSVISQLQPDDSGKIDLTNESEAHFIPE